MDVSKLFERAEEAIKRKNYDYAVDILLEQILPIYPNDVKARRLLRGTVQKKHQEFGAPSSLAAQVKSLGPTVKLQMLKMRKKYDQAILEAEKILLHAPRDVKTLFTLAVCCDAAGHSEAAISVLENLLAIQDNHIDGLKAMGALQEDQGDFEKAQNYYKKASKLDPSDNEARKAIKDLAAKKSSDQFQGAKSSYDLIKDKDKAKKLELDASGLRTEDDINKALKISLEEYEEDTTNKKLVRNIGDLYSRLEKHAEAIEWYEKFLEIDPTSFDVRTKIGDVKIARLDRDMRKVKAKLDKEPSDELKKKYVGLRKKKLAFQVEEYANRVKEHPTDLELRFHLGFAFFQTGKLDESIAEFQKAVKDPRRKIDSLIFMGQAFLKQEEVELAVKQFQRALKNAGSLPVEKVKKLRYNLAEAYEKNENLDEALEEYNQLMDVDINYKDVKSRVKALKQKV
ncbi:MAG: tetratricopeptide repeat protein [Planctomycetota bacterium]|jgi:tetratricopeptide (TPR) repeat protein|nr:tetratricopeptide repeat protein [Planctomycetota bacterium]